MIDCGCRSEIRVESPLDLWIDVTHTTAFDCSVPCPLKGLAGWLAGFPLPLALLQNLLNIDKSKVSVLDKIGPFPFSLSV